MRLRDFINLVEGAGPEAEPLNELSSDLVRKAQAQRHQELTQKSDAGKARTQAGHVPGERPTKASLDKYHDSENAAIDRDHGHEYTKTGKYDAQGHADKKAANERDRDRNMQRGRMVNIANKKLAGAGRVATTEEAEDDTVADYDLDEGIKQAVKGMALGAAALVSTNASAAPSKVDPEIVAASGDTSRTRPVAAKKDTEKKAAPAKKAVDPKAAAKKFHLDLK